ncbi:hypothetical protein STSO111631_15375 [Stackebrandtia soli]
MTGLAAVAKDRHYIAAYEFTRSRETVIVTASLATDGSWRFDVPGGALGGKQDISIVQNRQGTFQCVLDKTNACARVAKPEQDVPRRFDPLVQHPFTDWIDVLLSRTAPLSIAYAEPLVDGDEASRCFSMERNSVTVDAPIPTSTLCLAEDGVITAVDSPWGSLRLSGEVMPPTSRAKLPAVVTDDEPLSTSPPPKPSPKPSKTPSPSPSKKPADD